MIPERMAARNAMPTVPMIHFCLPAFLLRRTSTRFSRPPVVPDPALSQNIPLPPDEHLYLFHIFFHGNGKYDHKVNGGINADVDEVFAGKFLFR